MSEQVGAWPAFKFGAGGKDLKYRFGWNHHAAVFNPHDPKELLMGAQVVLATRDEGVSWRAISPDLTRNDRSKQLRSGGPISKDVTGEEMFDTISSIAFSPLQDGVIWTGSDDGLVYVTRDGGSHWAPVRPPQLPTWSTITCIEPSHTTAGTVYLSASRYDWDDFHPYVYKTTDWGKTWAPLTNGLPADEYVESIRQDPGEGGLLFAGTSRSVYFSLDGGAEWRPLRLNLPAVRVNDVEIQPAQHAVVLATFGRAFWVLDDLQYLEQLGSARVSSDAAYLFRPQQAWLGAPGGGFRGGAGRKAAGVTVLFHLPAGYDGSTPVKLSITTADGKPVNTYTLPLKPQRSRFGGRAARAVKLHGGMNRFQWNMRYPSAVEVKGIFHYAQQNGELVGPEVVPGTYRVTLGYGSFTQTRAFTVRLNPNLHTTQAQLQQRFDLLMRLHDAANRLDTALNRAIAARAALQKVALAGSPAAAPAQAQIAKLSGEIDGLVDLQIQA
ncbi:MAG: WD40/YVTN/BNR-like repeat-containing protein [Streptosporangiaceae bacterium]